MDTRLRVGRAIDKTEEEVAEKLMAQLKARGHPDAPPAIATDGNRSYRKAMVETWRQVPGYSGRGRPPLGTQELVLLQASGDVESGLGLGRLGLQPARPVKTLRVEVNDGLRRWQPCSPAMAAGLTDHIWTVKELLVTVVSPDVINAE